ncbi:hypothetical protein PV326_006742 [Microctonus aethiopoides]|nr:hypothetical protein PV326_006742 [Microctonus aethiopoides]
MCTVSEATASLIVLVAMTLLACDLNYSNKDVIMLNAISSLGMAVGSLIFGIVADYDGRKRLIPASMIIIFCASIGLSFSHTYFLISFSIFILGFGAAGNNAVLRIYLIECLPTRKHGTCLAFIDLIWIIGLIFALGISWSLAPSIIRMLGNEFRPSSWRVLVGVAGTPNLIMACGASLLPASPRYLISHRRLEQAMFVLQQMFAINNSQHMANIPSINLNDYSRAVDDEETSNDNFIDSVKLLFLKTWRRIVFVVSFNFIGHTLLLIAMRLFLFPGCIWLALWITHKFIHCTIKDGDLVPINNQTYCTSDFSDITMNFLTNCHKISDNYFKYLLIFSSSFIIGEVLLVIVIDIIGRRLSLITSGLVGATSILALAFTNSFHIKGQ